GLPTTNNTGRETGQPANRRGIKRGGAVAAGRQGNFFPQYYAWLFACGVASLIGYFVVANPNHKAAETLLLASLVLVVGCLPMWGFLRRGQFSQVPVLEAQGLFYALCFGLPGFLAPPELSAAATVDETDMLPALLATLLGLLALFFGYYVIGARALSRLRPVHLGK